MALEQLDWELELGDLVQAEIYFIRAVEDMDKQFIEIKKARIGLFDYDLPGLDRFSGVIVDTTDLATVIPNGDGNRIRDTVGSNLWKDSTIRTTTVSRFPGMMAISMTGDRCSRICCG
jgi:hypothetical protein